MEQTPKQVEKHLISIVQEFLTELKAERARRAISMHASLEKDLGIGSLEKAELFHRIEKAFAVQLPTQVMAEAKTLDDLATAILQAKPTIAYSKRKLPSATLETLELLPTTALTLVEVLTHYAKHRPHRPHIYLQDDQGNEHIITYGELFKNAIGMAHGLLANGLKPEETVAIMLPTCAEFFYVFFAILIAGGIPVPIYPPFRPDRIEEYATREAGILRNAETRFLITFPQGETLSKILQSFIPSLKAVLNAENLVTTNTAMPNITIEAENAGLIQYTSGSTGDPKGVLLTHRNLLTNIRTAGQAINIQPTDIAVSWLPLYHDMGLIGAWFTPLYFGIPVTIMSPLSFLSRPERWLWTIHYHRATLTAGPNFAYELCIRKIEKKELEGLDLSCWRLAFNGAEAIFPRTIKNFTEKFMPYGFKPEALFPVYGLAESTVALAFPTLGRPPRIDRIIREIMEKEGRAVPTQSTIEKHYLEFVCCGKPIPEHEIRIVDTENNEVPERTVGQLQFTGPSSMQGYYHNPAATQAIYHEGWWDSGDYAYKADGEIYITGRKKDLIIKAGRNLYPEAIEEIVAQIEGVRKGCVIAFGVSDKKSGTERLIIVAETRETQAEQSEMIQAKITEKVLAGIGISPDQIILGPPGTITKTSSGKLQRSACKQAYLQGKLTKHRLPAWWQISKLLLKSTAKKISNGIKNIGRLLYGIYLSLIILFLVILFLPVSLFLAKPRLAKYLRFNTRLLLYLSGCRLSITGRENLSKTWPMIIVANHASYVDVIVLIATLPADVVFIGKKEFLKIPIFKTYYNKLGHITVDRLDFMQSLADTQKITNSLEQGLAIVIFPEGTFTYATGLRPFKYGAFKVAVDTKTPICPIALRGTRNILRDGSVIPKRGDITITICDPIVPRDQGWHEIIRLSAATRVEIAKYCGEQAIDLIMAGPIGRDTV